MSISYIAIIAYIFIYIYIYTCYTVYGISHIVYGTHDRVYGIWYLRCRLVRRARVRGSHGSNDSTGVSNTQETECRDLRTGPGHWLGWTGRGAAGPLPRARGALSLNGRGAMERVGRISPFECSRSELRPSCAWTVAVELVVDAAAVGLS